MTPQRSVRAGFEQRFLSNLRNAGLGRGDRLVVGFSGGVDSLALSIALARVAPLLRCQVRLVHVDHQLRPESTGQVDQCRSLAEALGLDFRTIRLEPGLKQRASGIGLEEAARRERYLEISNIAAAWGASTIVLGHQANDQAETILLHLFRGAGLNGLAGMALREERIIPWWKPNVGPTRSFALVRPLLAESRPVIEDYLAAAELNPVLDLSNASTDFDRNWIRHQILPAVLARWPAAISSINHMANIARADLELLDQMANENVSASVPGGRTLCTNTLVTLPAPIARRILLHWLATLGVEDVTSNVVDRCYELVRNGTESMEIECGRGISVVLMGGRLTTLDELFGSHAIQLPLAGRKGETLWSVTIGDGGDPPQASIEAPKHAELSVHTLQAGDCWMGTRRSVFEDLRAAGIHPLVRPQLLAVVSETGVLMIPAIYPTIRTGRIHGEVKEVKIRWRKLGQYAHGSEKTRESSVS